MTPKICPFQGEKSHWMSKFYWTCPASYYSICGIKARIGDCVINTVWCFLYIPQWGIPHFNLNCGFDNFAQSVYWRLSSLDNYFWIYTLNLIMICAYLSQTRHRVWPGFSTCVGVWHSMQSFTASHWSYLTDSRDNLHITWTESIG